MWACAVRWRGLLVFKGDHGDRPPLTPTFPYLFSFSFAKGGMPLMQRLFAVLQRAYEMTACRGPWGEMQLETRWMQSAPGTWLGP